MRKISGKRCRTYVSISAGDILYGNIGVACGTASGIFAIDIDGADAECALRKLEAEYGELPASIEVITPRPGRHVYFKMPSAPVPKNSTGKVADNIDVRATGGYTLAPPSVGPSGGRYEWSVDCANTFAEAPAWLLDRITDRSTNGSAHIATPPSEWRTMMEGVPEGRRDCTLARITGYLLRHHIDPVFAAGLVRLFNEARCLPPLPVSLGGGNETARVHQSNCWLGGRLAVRGASAAVADTGNGLS